MSEIQDWLNNTGSHTTPEAPESTERFGRLRDRASKLIGRVADLETVVPASVRPFLESPRARDFAEDVLGSTVAGATEQFRGNDGKVSMWKVAKAAVRPIKTAKSAVINGARSGAREGAASWRSSGAPAGEPMFGNDVFDDPLAGVPGFESAPQAPVAVAPPAHPF